MDTNHDFIAMEHKILEFWEKESIFSRLLQKNKDGTPFVSLGHYTRGNTEDCFLGLRGRMVRKSAKVRQLIEAPRGKHSAKPPETRDRIVQLFGDLPRIELFAREKTDGWDVWGNEVESDINFTEAIT